MDTMSESLLRSGRRTYTTEFKESLVAEANRKGASVADIARRHGLNHNLIFKWKREAEAAKASAKLVPVQLVIEPPAKATPAALSPSCLAKPTLPLRVIFSDGASLNIEAAPETLVLSILDRLLRR